MESNWLKSLHDLLAGASPLEDDDLDDISSVASSEVDAEQDVDMDEDVDMDPDIDKIADNDSIPDEYWNRDADGPADLEHDEQELGHGIGRHDSLFFGRNPSVDGEEKNSQLDEQGEQVVFEKDAKLVEISDGDDEGLQVNNTADSDQGDTDGEDPLAEFRHWEAEYQKSVDDETNTPEQETELMARKKALRRRLMKKERDQTLSKEERVYLASGELYVEGESIQNAKNDYWSWQVQMDAEKDRPRKKQTTSLFSGPRINDQPSQGSGINQRSVFAPASSSKKRKTTFDPSNYLGPNLQTYYIKEKKRVTTFQDGHRTNQKKGETSKLFAFKVPSTVPEDGEPAQATDTPPSSADQQSSRLKQTDISKYLLRPGSASKPSAKVKEMVSSFVASNSNSKKLEKSIKGDEMMIKRARRHFHQYNKPKEQPTAAGGEPLWLSPRMKTSLKGHQVVGVGWMRRRETSGEAPHGGLFADDMGLGKTVQMIANIMDGKPSKEALKQGHRTTLIVLPSGLVKQWFAEIEKHAKKPGKVLLYTSHVKNSSNCPLETMQQADIIITTYEEVRSSYPNSKTIPSKLKGGARETWWRKNFEKKRDLLFQIHFWRIVLDEAQAIKNPDSETSIACRALRGNNRWLLTGTPLTDSVEEIYPYLKFLRVRFTGSRTVFKQNYCSRGNQVHIQRLRHILQTYMFRRTRHDKLLGQNIQELPRASEKDLWIEYSGPEKVVYEAILSKHNEAVQAWLDETADMKSASHFRLMEHLRRSLSHPLLVQDEFEEFDKKTLDNIKKEYAKQSTEQAYPKNLYAMQRMLFGNIPDDELLKGDNFGRKITLKKYFDALGNDQEKNRLKREILCSGCRIVPTMPKVNYCNHVYCAKCAQRAKWTAKSSGMDVECSEPKCDSFLDDLHDASEEEMVELAKTSIRKSKKTIDPKMAKERWTNITAAVDGVVLSAKTLAVKVQVLRWLTENPECKIIVFTLYPDMVKLLSRVCGIEKWSCVEIHGKVSIGRRSKVLEAFQNDKTIRILLATMGTGGVGLNLTAASRVLIMEPWWNAAMEQQAICRVWRMGQTEKTEFVRLRVRETVDERVLGKQTMKSERIDQLMKQQDEHQLKTAELLNLFGRRYDGSSFILQDDTEVPAKYLPDIGPEEDAAGDECEDAHSSDDE